MRNRGDQSRQINRKFGFCHLCDVGERRAQKNDVNFLQIEATLRLAFKDDHSRCRPIHVRSICCVSGNFSFGQYRHSD